MKKEKIYFIFVTSQYFPLLEPLGKIKTGKLGKQPYIICSDIDDKSPFFLKLIMAPGHPSNDLSDFAFELHVPNQVVVSIFAIHKKDYDKTLGFQGNQEKTRKPKK
jgi:hypothetical protein